jgi:PAS domain S-box-containing protein
MRLQIGSTTLGLALGVTAAVVAACTAAAYVYSRHHFGTLLDNARSTALAQGDLIRVALEHQMIENDRTLIRRMVESFGRQARVEQLVVLDRFGEARYSSRPIDTPSEFRIDSPTCQACHRYPPDQRGTSRVIETRGGTVLRTVIPIHNRESCYRCHGPQQKINGILILDYNTGEMRAAMTTDLRWMVAGAAALTLLLVSAIVLVVRLSVLRRLQRFETTARMIVAGDLARRVPDAGSDTIAWLAREFNTMADCMTGLVGEVRDQRERLERVINSIDDGIVVLDQRRQIIAANDAFLRRAGNSREALLGRCCRDAPGGCTVEDCPTLACLSAGGRQVRICERHTVEGSVAWEEVHASPILDGSGRMTHVVEVWRDISERRAAEAHLAESHRLASVGVLASGFSHELNTPLATVLMCVEGILRDAPPDQRIHESASIAREQLIRCRGITQHFLRMARGQSAGAEIIDAGAAIAAVERLTAPTARAHAVAVELQQVPPGLHVRADEAEFQNVLINLILNAIQACPAAGGHVSVTVEVGQALSPANPASGIHVRVRDNGCGISAESRRHIFEPFFSLRQGGTGLGLFLSLNAVRRWGGDITVESTVGEGSIFEVILPALEAASAV